MNFFGIKGEVMGDFILEHKKLSIFVLLAVIFYFFIAVPMERVFENKRDIEIKQKRYMGILKTEKIIKENIKKLKIRKEELSKIYEEKEKTGKKYTSVGEFQKEIDILFFKNNIEIKEIGRNIFKEDKCTIPYTVVGTEKDIINFLFETDKMKIF